MFEFAFLAFPIFGNIAVDWQTAQRSTGNVLVYRAATGKDPRPILSIECRHGATSVAVYWRRPLAAAITQSIKHAIDNDLPRTKYWQRTADSQSIAMWGASSISFAKQLIGKSQLVVYARSRSNEILQARFSLDGLNRAIEPVAQACRWRPAQRVVSASSVLSGKQGAQLRR
jgi:type VI secretion system VasI family protein